MASEGAAWESEGAVERKKLIVLTRLIYGSSYMLDR